MAGIEPISAAGGTAAATKTTGTGSQDGADAQIQSAFAQGIVQYMGTMFESMESDIQQACQDDTSDPDAPS